MPKSANKPFDWKHKGAEKALHLTFEGRWTQEEIAKKCEISPRTLWSWLQHPGFQAKLEALRADFAASIRDVAYADKAQRIVGLSQMAESARREFEARPWLKEVRPTPDGELTNESFNRDAHAAFRGALDDIAKELGQRTSKVDVTSDGQRFTGLDAALATLLGAGDGQRRATGILDTIAGDGARGTGRESGGSGLSDE